MFAAISVHWLKKSNYPTLWQNQNPDLKSRTKQISVSNPKYPCGVCNFGAGANSMSCTSCDLSVQNYSCKTDCLTDNKFKKCFGEIIPAAIASLNIGMTNLMSNPPSIILAIQLTNVVVVLTQSLQILFHHGKHSENCYLSSPTVQSKQSFHGMSTAYV